MKWMRSIVAGLAGIVCLYFSLLHITPVVFNLTPFHHIQSFNLSFIILLFFGFGFLSGALIVWLGGFEKRRQAAANKKTLEKQEKELSKYHEDAADKNYNLLQNQG